MAVSLGAVRARIERACEAVGRDPSEVTLVAVSKTHPVEKIREAYELGQRVFGESYAQELVAKAEALQLDGIEWRMIGHLQRNKAKRVVGVATAVDSVDSLRLAAAIDRHARDADRIVDVCIEVNVAAEPQKAGVTLDALDALVGSVRELDALRLEGLMTVPPAEGDPRPCFAALREAAERHGLKTLSMGMSGDLEQAIAEGATMVRIGTAIFGPRTPPAP